MIERRYNSTATTDWFNPTNWTPYGFPSGEDKAIFASDSASCTLTGEIEVQGGLEFQGGYAGSLTSNGVAIKCGGFIATLAISGVVDLSNSTITNTGTVDLRGFTTTNFNLTNSTWIQRGGTENTPVSFYHVNSLFYNATLLDLGGVIKFETNATNFGVNYCIFRGHLIPFSSTSQFGVNRTNGPLEFVKGFISDFSTITAWYNVIGYTEGLNPNSTLYLEYAGKCENNILPCNLVVRNGASSRIRNINGTTIQRTLSVRPLAGYTLTVNMNDVILNGDVEIVTGGTLVISSNQIKLNGSNDQRIDFSQISNTINIIVDKPAGNVMLINGNYRLQNDATFGGVLGFQSGFAGSFVTGGYQMRLGGFDASHTIAGVIDIRNSIVECNGNFEQDGTTNTTLLVTGCNLILSGGSSDKPHIFSDVAYLSPNTIQRRFSSITVVDGAYFYFKTSTNQRLAISPVIFNVSGNITTSIEVWCINSTTSVNFGSTLTSTNIVRIYGGTFYGYDMSKFLPKEIYINASTQQTKFYAPRCNVPVRTSIQTAITSNIEILSGTSFINEVDLRNTLAGATINLTIQDDVAFYHNIISTSTAPFYVYGILLLSGANDQVIDLRQVTAGLSPLHIDLAKTRGSVDVLSDVGICISGVHANAMTLRGSATYMFCGDTTLMGDVYVAPPATLDFSNATGNIFVNRWTTTDDMTVASGVHFGTLTVSGSKDVTIDLSKTLQAQRTIFDSTGTVTVIVAGFGTIHDIKLVISGNAKGLLLSGTGTVILGGDMIANSVVKDETIIFRDNGFDIFDRASHFVMLDVASFPVDSSGIPIFRQTTFSEFTGIAETNPSRMTDVRFVDNMPVLHIHEENKDITAYSKFLPVSTVRSVDVVNEGADHEIRAYKNTGHVDFPINSKNQMIVAIAETGNIPVERYESYRTFSWPLNQHGTPIIKVVT